MTHKSALECIATMDTADMPDKAKVVRLFKAIARAALHTCRPTEIEVDSSPVGLQAQNRDGTINRT